MFMKIPYFQMGVTAANNQLAICKKKVTFLILQNMF